MKRRQTMRSSLDVLRERADLRTMLELRSERHAEMRVEHLARIYRLNPCPHNHRLLGDAVQNLIRRAGGRWNGHVWQAP